MSLLEALEKELAPHSSALAWKIPWTEEPGGLQSMWSRRAVHDWETSLSLFAFMIGEGNGNPLHCSCLENPRDMGAWWAAVYGVQQGWTRLKRLSSSSSSVKHDTTILLKMSIVKIHQKFYFLTLNKYNILRHTLFFFLFFFLILFYF